MQVSNASGILLYSNFAEISETTTLVENAWCMNDVNKHFTFFMLYIYYTCIQIC